MRWYALGPRKFFSLSDFYIMYLYVLLYVFVWNTNILYSLDLGKVVFSQFKK